MKYVKKVDKISIPVKEGDYALNNAPKNIKFLYNSTNTVSSELYYEYTYDEEKEEQEKATYYFKVIAIDKEPVEIPAGYEYVCAVQGADKHTVYLIYFYSPDAAVFGKFMNMFGGF